MNPLNFLALRNMREKLKRAAGIVKDAPGMPSEHVRKDECIRLPAGLVRPENAKRAIGNRSAAAIDLMVGHVTDVSGGFGIQKWGPDGWRRWTRRLKAGDVPGVSYDRLSLLEDIGGMALSDAEFAEFLALCSRLAQLPYHRLTSRKLGECENRPLVHRTYASGAGNGGIALAMDCGHREPIGADFAAAGQNMVRGAYYDLRRFGSKGRIRYAPHGCFSRDRWNDTNRTAHLAVYKPAILALQASGEDVAIDYERQVGGGRAITTRDDPEAHFDTKGRRVRTREGTPT